MTRHGCDEPWKVEGGLLTQLVDDELDFDPTKQWMVLNPFRFHN
jgi:hypothetical protein